MKILKQVPKQRRQKELNVQSVGKLLRKLAQDILNDY